MLMLAAVTGIFAVAAVVKVKVGRSEPPPRPTIATPAVFSESTVAEEIVSAWPAPTNIISPRPAVQLFKPYCRVANGDRYVPRLPSEPPLAPTFSTVLLLTQNTLPGCICSNGIPRTLRPFAKPSGKLVIVPPIGILMLLLRPSYRGRLPDRERLPRYCKNPY